MFDLFNREENFNRKLANLERENERLDKAYQDLLDEFSLTEEKLFHYLSNKTNFSEEEWETLSRERNKMEKELLLKMKKKASTHSKEVQRHWIHAK
ncbi:MAG: hypothetical protein ACK5MA_02410 [Parachlamydiaceae bacterium]